MITQKQSIETDIKGQEDSLMFIYLVYEISSRKQFLAD